MLKKRSLTLLLIAITLSSSVTAGDDLQQVQRDTDAVWRTGAGSEDGTFTAVSLSMLGWGIGLAAGIAILCSVLHQSTATAHSHSGT